jgi:broad specificity phosphatase PhoE
MQKANATILHIVRHGETDWNTLNKIQGHTDIPLNEQGIKQALTIKQHFSQTPFNVVYSSDLKRAHQTAELIIQDRNLSIKLSENLRERCFGILEGMIREELPPEIEQKVKTMKSLSRHEYVYFKLTECHESFGELYSRVFPFLLTIHQNHPGENILIVTHAGVIRALLLMHQLLPGKEWSIANCSHIVVKISGEEVSLVNHYGIEASSGH